MKTITFQGRQHRFPDDATDEEIQAQLQSLPAPDDGTGWMQDYQPPLTEGVLSNLPESVQAGVLGAGHVFDRGIAGAQDLWAGATGNDQRQQQIAQQQAGNAQAYSRVQEQHPIATTVGEIAPFLATAPLSGGIGTQMAIGAATDGILYEPEGTDQLANAAEGAAWSAAPFGIGKAWNKAFPGGEASRLVQRADEMGYGLTPGERMDSDWMRMVEAGIESTPMPFNPVQARHRGRGNVVNRAVGNAMGEAPERSGRLSPDVLGDAASNIGEEFDELIRGRSFALTDDFFSKIDGIDLEAKRGIFGGADIGSVVENIKGIAGDSGNMVDGPTIQSWRTLINEAIDTTYGSDKFAPGFRDSLETLRTAVDDAIEFNLRTASEGGDDLAARWANAREKWTAFKRVERSNAVRETGDVYGAKLGNSLSTQDKYGYGRGGDKSEMYDAARLSRSPQFRPIVGDSGTATRGYMGQYLRNPIKGTLGLMGGNAAARGYMMGADAIAGNPQARQQVGRMASRIGQGSTIEDVEVPAIYDEQARGDIGLVLGAVKDVAGVEMARGLTEDADIAQWTFSNRDRDMDQGEVNMAKRELISLLQDKGLQIHQATKVARLLTQEREGALAEELTPMEF